MTTRKIAVISAGLTRPSSTRMLADRLADATARNLREQGVEVQLETIELRDYAHDVTNNLLTGFPSPALESALENVTGADGIIAVSPIFSASYSGLFKSFMDILDPESLIEMPVLIGATGGTARHSLALEHALRPLFAYLRADVVPTAVYAATADWGNEADPGTSLPERIERAAAQFARAVAASDRAAHVRDPFALTESFTLH